MYSANIHKITVQRANRNVFHYLSLSIATLIGHSDKNKNLNQPMKWQQVSSIRCSDPVMETCCVSYWYLMDKVDERTIAAFFMKTQQ